ncbi:hypothetical protein IWW38_006325, partial [Coemansia aciculifera]
ERRYQRRADGQQCQQSRGNSCSRIARTAPCCAQGPQAQSQPQQQEDSRACCQEAV